MFVVSRHGPFTRLRLGRTVLGRTLHEVSVYLVEGLLVDTGPPATAGAVAAWARERRAAGELDRVVLTHHHEDHVGAAARLGRSEAEGGLGLPVLAPEGALPILLEGARIPPYRKLVWGTPERLRCRRLGEPLEHRDLRVEVIPTPGHAFDHVVLFEPRRRWLFSGDLYVHPRVKYLRKIEDLDHHVDSLRRVLELEPEVMICAHAGVVEPAVPALEAKLAWWRELGERCRTLADAGYDPAHIARRLLGRDGPMAWLSLGDFSKAHLVRALLGSDRFS